MRVTKKKIENSPKRRIEHWEIIALYLVLYDIVAVNSSYFIGLLLRFDLEYSSIPTNYLSAYVKFAPVYTIFVIGVFYVLKLYNSLWRFASFSELNRILVATVITTVFHVVGITVVFGRMPFAYYSTGCILQFLFVVAVRFGYRYITLERIRRIQSAEAEQNVMIIGAGAAGQVILKEFRSSLELKAKPRCIIDDHPNKWGRVMQGVPIVGGRDSIMEAARKL